MALQSDPKFKQPALMKVAEGAPIALIGSVLNVILVAVLAILIARHVDQSEFGFFCLSLTIVRFLSILSELGFSQGLPRYIAYQLGKGEYGKVWGSIVSSVCATSLLGLFFGLSLHFNAEYISQLLHQPGLAQTIKVMAFVVPCMALVKLLVAQLRAMHEVKGGVFFQYISRPFTSIVLMCVVMVLGLSYTWVLWAYAISFFATLVALAFFAKGRISKHIPTRTYSAATKEILLFSLPLLGSGILAQILMSTDTLFLGYFKSAESVGLYNGALRLAQLIPILSTAAAFTYLPVTSKLFSQNKVGEIREVYSTITKWVFIATMPLFLYVFFASDFILHLCFGAKYAGAGLPLEILSLGYFLHISFGLNAITCIALGKVRLVFVAQLLMVAANVVLDVLLIPRYGVIGASITSLCSLISGNVLVSIFIYRHSAIHPFSRKYLRMIIFAGGITIILCLLPARDYINHTTVGAIIFPIFSLAIPVAGVLVTNAITAEDISVIGRIEERLTKSTYYTDKYVMRFKRN